MKLFPSGCCIRQACKIKKMADDDVYEIDSVPRFADFGDIGRIVNETVGDKFFEYVASVENKENSQQNKLAVADCKSTGKTTNKTIADPSKKEVTTADEDDPLGMRKLAMFRPPRRSRDLVQTAQKKTQVDSTPRPVEPIIIRSGSSALRESNKKIVKNHEIKGTELGTPGLRSRSASIDTVCSKDKPRIIQDLSKYAEIRKAPVTTRSRFRSVGSPVVSMKSLKIESKTGPTGSSQKKVEQVTSRYRSGSVDSARINSKAKPLSDGSSATSKPLLRTFVRRSLPQQENPVSNVSNNSKNTNCRSGIHLKPPAEKEIRRPVFQGSSRSRPITRAFAAKSEAVKLKRDETNSVGTSQPSNSSGVPKSNEKPLSRVDSVGSEMQFRNAVRRRPAGGESLERPIKPDKELKPKEGNEISSNIGKGQTKINVSKSYIRRPSEIKKAVSPLQRPSVPRISAIRQRRSAAERDAFFKRLSTPKCVNVIKKNDGDTPRKPLSKPTFVMKDSEIPLSGFKTRVLRPRSGALKTTAIRANSVSGSNKETQ